MVEQEYTRDLKSLGLGHASSTLASGTINIKGNTPMYYRDACEEVGFNPHEKCPIQKQYVYYGYKNGESKKFLSLQEAHKFSQMTETKVLNQEDFDMYYQNQKQLEAKAVNVWYTALRKDYEHLSDKLFTTCYSYAYADAHSDGYDNIADKMQDYVTLTDVILKEVIKEQFVDPYLQTR